ncbi:putative ABC transport system substrate-binding protein [Psychrobacillus psychrotolerans]|uniref:Putative ABC transport system substrate-binding protein n=1 Tax=Psychrobacillus psychrotolerans TaxID=126156 RepID=A0A1I5VNP5_9BACI|nr:ABC transporter substrate-binding protein [Psychrobacillus psychrotolerans]SFQ09052.1 putative ABC transport system substrate-binding protein [Psychrobacillus psychrotolerans]
MGKTKKKFGMVLSAAVLLLAACGTDDSAATKSTSVKSDDKEVFKIGVTQIVEHPSLNAAYEGFQKAIEDAGLEVEYQYENAQNDNSLNSTIANNLVNSGADLIFANSTPSAQAVAALTEDIPIVFTSVTNAVDAELVDSMESPGGNVTGTVDTQPDAIPNTIAFLKNELGAKNVGMVFNAGEQNSRSSVDAVKEEMAKVGLNVVEASVSTSAEVKQATESLIGKVDSLYIITDNTVVSALESVVDVANEHKLPMMVGEFDSVKRGGLGAYGFEFYDIGYEAGEMAVKILKGESKPADLAVQYPQNLKFVLNKDTVDALGIEVKDEWESEFAE